MDRFHERLREEWEHPAFPHQFPETTTGEQALAYLREVWARARSSPDRLANEVRNVLSTAYAYCLEDMSDNDSLAERWNDVVRDAAVFDGREWIYPLSIPSYFHKMANILLYSLCSASMAANSSSNGRNRSGGQLGICS